MKTYFIIYVTECHSTEAKIAANSTCINIIAVIDIKIQKYLDDDSSPMMRSTSGVSCCLA